MDIYKNGIVGGIARIVLVFFEIVGLIEIIAGMVNYIKSKTYKDKLEDLQNKDVIIYHGLVRDITSIQYFININYLKSL
mgnify:CR=1 FL=1